MNTPHLNALPRFPALHYVPALLAMALMLLASCSMEVTGELSKDNDDEGKDPDSWKELSSTCQSETGLFTLWTRGKDGKVYLEISPDHLDREFIYISMIEDAPLTAGHHRGEYLNNSIVSFRRHFDRVELWQEVLGHYFDPGSPLHRSKGANLSPALIASLKICAEGPGGALVVNASELFLKERLQQIRQAPDPGAKAGTHFVMGELSTEKTRFHMARTYPRNVNLSVDYVFENPLPAHRGGPDLSDPRYTRVRVMHAFAATPAPGFTPRRDDPRVGYFISRFDDRTAVSSAPWRDVIQRWRLEKKDPAAPLSEPVKPITFWIENSTPHELRSTIERAALAWNLAFEKAGFKNALEVKVQPDDATWDAGDLDHNVLRWTSSPNPPFGGYGPCFTDPRTGEILGADIMLEWGFITRRLQLGGALGRPGAAVKSCCFLGAELQAQCVFGLAAGDTAGFGDWRPEKNRLVYEALHYLVLHEIGHTLGLMHNMKSSNLHPPEKLHDRSLTESAGLTGSVMDYPAINLADPGQEQGTYFTTRPGPYDLWAIEYGYSPTPSGTEEEAHLGPILVRSTEAALLFGNDADDMRSPGSGIDPRVNIGDMSSDGLAHAAGRLRLVATSMGSLVQRFEKMGDTHQDLVAAYKACLFQAEASATVVSRFIGGVMVDRAHVGQKGAGEPYTAVPMERQKKAMDILHDEVFAPGALEPPAELARRLQPRRRDFDFFNGTENPKYLEVIHKLRSSVLDHLLSPSMLTRLSDSSRYGNTYTSSQCLDDLRQAVFVDDIAGRVDDGRKALQLELVTRLLAIVKPDSTTGHDAAARAAAHAALIQINLDMVSPSTDTPTRAHREHLKWLIKRGLEGR